MYDKKCCICNEELHEDSAIFFVDKQSNAKEVCGKCAGHIQSIDKFEFEDDVKAAVNYLYFYMDKIAEAEVKENVAEILYENRGYIDNQDKVKDFPVPKSEKNKLEFHIPSVKGSAWISGMRIIAWLIFISIIIVGIVMGIGFGLSLNAALGVLIFIVSLLVAFLAVAWIMITLDQARDIRIIRNMLEEEEI